MKKVQSTCNYCALACNLDYMVEDDKIVKVIPTKHYPVNKGFSCIKGLNLDKQHLIHKPNPLPRLKRQTVPLNTCLGMRRLRIQRIN